MSASYGDTDTARAGKVGPYNWVWSTSGAPDAYFGDRSDKNQGGANNQYTTYDSLFSSGGGMHPTVNDYGMEAAIYQNGNSYDVSISYVYTGTGTPAGNMKLYAALVDKDCTGYSTVPVYPTVTIAGWLGSPQEIPTNPRVQVQEMLSIASLFRAPKKASHGQEYLLQ